MPGSFVASVISKITGKFDVHDYDLLAKIMIFSTMMTTHKMQLNIEIVMFVRGCSLATILGLSDCYRRIF